MAVSCLSKTKYDHKKTPQILASKSRHCKQPDKTSGLWPQMKTLPFMGEMCFVPLPFK